ncbi:DNA-binding response regulator [Caldinitratiruptor microaerophilus]|uniref:Stage 0 sporulation protein A homolog n=1 Tax=Caldinitratiruptor microaerophilus TaxID=671077 RepID=A0AA35CMU8_9FIRM|nr:DNA-binding response regulator [Caldinitratiruptor microaerophilus]
MVDDHGVVRLGLRALLAREPDIEVVGEAATGEEALAVAQRSQPHVVLLDLRLPDRDGVSVCRELHRRFPEVRVVILTSFADRHALVETVTAGARGYILKDLDNGALLAAIRTVARGGMALDPSLGPMLAEAMQGARGAGAAPARGSAEPPAMGPDPSRLTAQERRILECVARGMTNREIGRTLFLSEKTVRNYLSEILGRYGFRNRAEAAAYAVRAGIAGPGLRPGR